MAELTIDGKKVVSRPGETILQVAKRYGIKIPNLCHHDEVKPYTACRLCLVEIKKGKRTKIVTSCDYPAEEGLEVKTSNEKIEKSRKMLMELYLSRCPNLPVIQKMAEEMGVKEPRFEKENEDCILCGLCVRVCSEVVGRHALGYESRGPERRVVPPFDEPNPLCISCGACTYVCPVDVIPIEEKDGYRIMERWHKKSKLVACEKCGKYFATEEEIEWLKEMGLPEDKAKLCMDCR